ncbi:hypothetical protein HPB50_025061 [Hyalomma asiaticum]|uniref:Uncharacterized protein n=1 Tax=Hyalomma asiaticum TaxID=266040 RepID=A0ACB7TCC4_HYAAI|nr:hypothetical protein HPB50_025061 [Hyalomma asiaticum]
MVVLRHSEQHICFAKARIKRQLLLDCGIGTDTQPEQESVVHAHRALIFCQLKSMLDIVEKDLLMAHMSSVSYLRLDGSVAPGQRQALVQRFNADPSIDVLLLTTQVGGLGLNLTGADTVIFVEHDWNPMKDLQAMDRAHRIGQKKVVNVYRLITRGTLEEKIMGTVTVFVDKPGIADAGGPPDDQQTLAKCPRFPHRAQVRLQAGQALELAQCCDKPQRKHAPTQADDVAGEEAEAEWAGSEKAPPAGRVPVPFCCENLG